MDESMGRVEGEHEKGPNEREEEMEKEADETTPVGQQSECTSRLVEYIDYQVLSTTYCQGN